MGVYKPSASREQLGFNGGHWLHPRSRWAGNRYWLVANREAVPKRIVDRTRRISLDPKRVNGVVGPVQDALKAGRVLPVHGFGDPMKYKGTSWVQPVRVADGVFGGSRLSVAINADFLRWVARFMPSSDGWYLTLDGVFVCAHKRRVNAIIMSVRVPTGEVLRLYGETS